MALYFHLLATVDYGINDCLRIIGQLSCAYFHALKIPIFCLFIKSFHPVTLDALLPADFNATDDSLASLAFDLDLDNAFGI